MEINVIWLFILIKLNNIILGDGFKIQATIFRVHGKHPDLRSCANDILHNNTVVGARLSDHTGKCENLTDETHALESGYRYVEKITSEMIDPFFRNLHLLSLPRTMWSRLDFKFVRKPPSEYNFFMENDKKSDDGFPLRVSVQESEKRLILQYPVRGGLTVPFDWQIMCPMDECKISLVLNDKQMEILANNRKVQNATYEVERTLVRQRRAVFIDPRSADAGFISFAFTKQ